MRKETVRIHYNIRNHFFSHLTHFWNSCIIQLTYQSASAVRNGAYARQPTVDVGRHDADVAAHDTHPAAPPPRHSAAPIRTGLLLPHRISVNID